jgi:flagellar biosynthetic protein FlhB
MADDLGERSEDATPRRMEQAREEGNVSKSVDLAGALLLLAGTVVTAIATMPSLRHGLELVGTTLDFSQLGDVMRVDDIGATVMFVSTMTAKILLPALFGIWFAAYLAHFWQVGFLFSVKSLQPNLGKLNPLAGAKRIFGISGLMKVTLDSLKVIVVLVVAVQGIMRTDREIIMLPQLTMLGGVAAVAGMMLELALQIVAALIILGIIDLMYQKWKHSQDLRMTKQQVKDEHKQLEGDPETKKRRMRMQQQIAMQRIGIDVPKADVIVTNPEHISIAIKYDSGSMGAPRVVAKGADFLAMRIRQIARQHNIPIVERKPLARALYRDVSVGQEVPPQFYHAVAEILAYVYRLSGRAAG